jgi:DNA-binding NarL/FixJ family response regulator
MITEDVRCVVLADRHHRLMEGVRGLLETTFEVVVMVADEISLSTALDRMPVALAVVDLSLTPGQGFGLVRRLRTRFPGLKLIVVGVHGEIEVARSALDAGADGFVVKRSIATDLYPAVDAVLEGQSYVSPSASSEVRQ